MYKCVFYLEIYKLVRIFYDTTDLRLRNFRFPVIV